jgi:hypothetical protein
VLQSSAHAPAYIPLAAPGKDTQQHYVKTYVKTYTPHSEVMGQPVVQWFNAPVSVAGDECAARSAVVRTTVVAKKRKIQTGMRCLMDRLSGVFSEYFGFLPSFKG